MAMLPLVSAGESGSPRLSALGRAEIQILGVILQVNDGRGALRVDGRSCCPRWPGGNNCGPRVPVAEAVPGAADLRRAAVVVAVAAANDHAGVRVNFLDAILTEMPGAVHNVIRPGPDDGGIAAGAASVVVAHMEVDAAAHQRRAFADGRSFAPSVSAISFTS